MVHARDSLLRGACRDLYERFEVFVDAVSKTHNLSLARPHFQSIGDIKRFCSGLLEGQSNHPWRLDLQRSRASSRTRMSIAFSLFLFRKLIPSEKPQLVPYVERMSQPGDAADPAFLAFCRGQIRRMFHVGWDRRYQDKCTMSTLPVTSCSENGRSAGGCRGLIEQARMEREEFSAYVSESVAPVVRGVSRVEAVLAGDKWRIISVPPVWDNALRPFHQCLYDYVSKMEWCLRGDALPRRFGSFTRVPGEVFVSGDYESATDNLNSEVQSTILSELIMRSRTIPSGIRQHALSTFNSELSVKGVVYEQRRGQLMGQLLSFPLLCLVNYLTFKFSVPRDVPVKINGDDIVFRAREDEVDRWRENVGRSGLKLSVGKTLVNPRFFSLNSCMFESTPGGTRWVPFVRSKALWGDGERECERIASLAPRFGSFVVSFGKRRRELFHRVFLSENKSSILRSRRSITRGLGMKVTEETLRAVGLWHRELFYLESETEPPLPFMSFSQTRCNDLPPGWVQVSPHWHPPEVVRGWSYRLSHEMVKSAWTRRVLSDSEAEKNWMRALDEGVSPWGLESCLRGFKTSLLRMSRRQVWRWRVLRSNSSLFGRVRFTKGKGVWRPGTDVPCDPDEENESSACTGFVSGVTGNRDPCGICMVGLVVRSTPCGHFFCASCLDRWRSVSSTCPVCRSSDVRHMYNAWSPPESY